ncbi:hypothetical protein SAMN04488058_101340 [Deinococcus reticulitermitis]|uniref:Helix-turn-helix n=1 Tax=Deinococcus reticulitermitis TaxID=856736 RepID=A0A1H6SXB3_9DEIO|nr:hypothetical protein [Deinococcus reticulitermitis]SEI68615.1 hypothetical protein SAMN04488058_101340 [Deinococcus reticulitermitis]
MTPEELSTLLQNELQKRGWTVDDLAEKAGVAYETARRATQAIGSISLPVTTKLLVAVDKRLTVQDLSRSEQAGAA